MSFYYSSIFVWLAAWAYYASATGPPVFLFTLFPISSEQLRDQLISRMDNISHWSFTNEPGVVKYALVTPRNGDNKTAYSIEQYVDDTTFQTHLAAEPVVEILFNWTRSTPNVFAKNVTVQNFTVIDGMSFVKPEFAKFADPYIVVEAIGYKNGTISKAVELWKAEVSASRNENGTLAFGVYKDPVDQNRLYTLAAYESEDYLSGTHAKSAVAEDLDKNTRDSRTGVEQTLLQMRGGFLYKGSQSCG